TKREARWGCGGSVTAGEIRIVSDSFEPGEANEITGSQLGLVASYRHRVAPPGGAGAAAVPNRPQNPQSRRAAAKTIGHGPGPRRLASRRPPPGPTATAFRRRPGRRSAADREDRCQIVLA